MGGGGKFSVNSTVIVKKLLLRTPNIVDVEQIFKFLCGKSSTKPKKRKWPTRPTKSSFLDYQQLDHHGYVLFLYRIYRYSICYYYFIFFFS